MRVHSAQLAGGDRNDDRVHLTDNAVIVLDGASTDEPLEFDPGSYADTLGAAIAANLIRDPDAPLADAVAAAISHTAHRLQLVSGRSSSSTVTILRATMTSVDLYVLGDSPIHYATTAGEHQLTDTRLSHVATIERETYQAQLRAGHGYGSEHRAALAALRQAQQAQRNRDGGYWIAEADPSAAHHARTLSVSPDAITWAVLATDGIANHLDHHQYDWSAVARYDAVQLRQLLQHAHTWETVTDPDGIAQPRAKRHDDKTIVTIPTIE